MKVLPTLKTYSTKLILTDPPYGVGLEYDNYNDDYLQNWYNLFSKFIIEAKRIASMTILPSCRMASLKWIYNNYPPDWLICWYKGSTGHRAFIGFNDWEPLLVYGKNKKVQMHDYFFCQPERRDLGHPCPKPVKWAKWLIERTTEPNDIILDPFLGSGTTMEACQELNRNCIGIEISPKYCEIVRKRCFGRQFLDREVSYSFDILTFREVED
jgi:site-specific DNA-methyltransferase (adenine-specific)